MNSKNSIKILKYLGLSLFAFLLVYGLAVVILADLSTDKEIVELEELTIYLKSNGVHTDIVVPVKNDYKDDYAIEAENLIMQFGDFIAVNNVNLKNVIIN